MRHLTLQCVIPTRAMLALPLLLAGLAQGQTAVPQPAAGTPAMQAAAMAPARFYTVVNLGSGNVTGVPVFNRFGQLAYTLGGAGFFFDGRAIVPVPGVAIGLNDKGQVAGFASGPAGDFHGIIWSKQAGAQTLLPLDDGAFAQANDINNCGVAVGASQISRNGVDHAVRWPRPGSAQDLGSLGPGRSEARAINDAGLVAGTSVISSTVSHAFAWTPATGLIDIGTLGGDSSEARAVDEFGEVAGNSFTRPPSRQHVFLWTRSGGIRDLGTDGGTESAMLFMSSKGRIAGRIIAALGRSHAMTWTRATGMKDIGTLRGGIISQAWGANNAGLVVGESLVSSEEPFHAFVWSAASGMVDLNKRVPRLPKGMLLQTALAVSDTGAIAVRTNTGLVLLKPGRCGCGAAVGPIEAADTVAAGTPYFVSINLVDDDAAAVHSVSWSWGDGGAEPASKAIERGGEGNVNASHVYGKPGTYQVTAQVTDNAGHATTVSRQVVVQGPAGG